MGRTLGTYPGRVHNPDNLKPVVTDADAVNPRFSVGWLDYSQHAGFVTDPARVRSPQDKGLVSYCASLS
jgi:transposase